MLTNQMKRFRDFIARLWHEMIGLHDTPHAIAGGVAIGIFFGFTPLFGFKTLLAMLVAWTFRCSYVAAAVAVSLHDVVLPLIPVILRLEYRIGYFLLQYPHLWPPKLEVRHLHFGMWFHWSSFVTIGWPTLVGSVIFSGPIAAVSFFVTLPLVRRYQAIRADKAKKSLLGKTIEGGENRM